jgi:hypothetical protein
VARIFQTTDEGIATGAKPDGGVISFITIDTLPAGFAAVF